jgi:hypothetical protein
MATMLPGMNRAAGEAGDTGVAPTTAVMDCEYSRGRNARLLPTNMGIAG